MSGRFISFEGGEGVGKSTQARLLADALTAAGIESVVTREPGGTPGAEAIRKLLLDHAGPESDGDGGQGWGPRAEALLFAAARSDHVETLIRPALARGAWVICDRFLDSSRAYQGGFDDLTDADVMALHEIGSRGFLPHTTILLEIDPETAAARLAKRDAAGSDRIGGRDPAYHARVREAFARLAEADPHRIHRVSAEGTPHDVHARVMAALR